MKFRKIVIAVMIVILMLATWSGNYANSAEPPAIIIIVPGGNDNLKLELVSARVEHSYVEDKIIEDYYLFYVMNYDGKGDYVLSVEADGEHFELPITDLNQYYNNVYTLDVKNRTLTEGRLPFRSMLLVLLRLGLTLCIEGLIFAVFGFRQKASWIGFLLINLVTQGALNLWISTMPVRIGYGIIAVLFFEMIIVLIEMATFITLLKEHTKLRRGLYAFIANGVSLVAGLIIITSLPI